MGPPFGQSPPRVPPTSYHGSQNPPYRAGAVPGANLNPDSCKLIQDGNLLPRKQELEGSQGGSEASPAAPRQDENGSPLLLKVMSVLMDAKRKDQQQRGRDTACVQATEIVNMLVRAGGWGEDSAMGATEARLLFSLLLNIHEENIPEDFYEVQTFLALDKKLLRATE